MRPRIETRGIREFQRSLRQMEDGLQKELRPVFNGAAQVVVDAARPKVPRRTGAAAASLKVRSSQREGRLAAGGRRAPHYPWLDFGGNVGPNDSVSRPFVTIGRYVYPAVVDQQAEIQEVMSQGLTRLAGQAGLEVT